MEYKKVTKEAYKLLSNVYGQYLERRDWGESRDEAILFRFSTAIAEWLSEDDIYSCLTELNDAGFITLYINGDFRLNASTLIYLEERFKRGIKDVIDLLNGGLSIFDFFG